jgi:hypothetical protein
MDIENTNENTGEVTRDDLIAAVREAGGTESVDVAAEAAAAGQPPPAKEEPEAPAAGDEEDSKLAAILKMREEARAKRHSTDEYVAQLRRQAEEDTQRMIAEAKAEARRIAAEELEAERAKFRASPTAHLRAIAPGGDVQSVVDAVMREGTPEARALAEAQERVRRAEAAAEVGKSAKEELERFKAEQEQARRDAIVAQEQARFLAQFAAPEKTPYLHARFEPEEIFQRANALCVEWQKEGLILDRDFDRNTLAAYLEKQSRERVSRVVGAPQQVGGAASAREPGHAPKVSANGTRTLSAVSGSERRASPKPVAEMTPDEEREVLIEAVREARRQSGAT